MTPLAIAHYSLVSAVGRTRSATLSALKGRRGGLRPCDFLDYDLETYIGRVEGIERSPIRGALAHFDCRNNRLARLALEADGFAGHVQAAAARYGAARIAVFVGTSTSGILESELAYRRRREQHGDLPADFAYRYVHDTFAVADFTRQFLRLKGPAFAISTACSSSAKAIATASRFIESGLCDAAVVGGVDSLCGTTLFGFHALQLTSGQPCRPMDRQRDGISIGEAGGFALLEKAHCSPDSVVRVLGYGESSDAYHMSSPHPEGAGAMLSMKRAMARAGLAPHSIEHVFLHGTGTLANDAAEDKALHRVFADPPPCSSIKAWTGHTLGAAGIVNALVASLSLESGFVPGTLNFRQADPGLCSRVLSDNREQALRFVMSNAFGFGGNNASLIFGAERS